MHARTDRPATAPARTIRLLFLAHSLDAGGAEVQIAALARQLDLSRFEPSVLCFHGGGVLEAELRQAGVPVAVAGKRGRADVVGLFIRLAAAVRRAQPHIIYSFLTFPNVVAALMQPAWPKAKIVWGIRDSYLDLGARDLVWRLMFALEKRLARHPDLIICNSNAGRRYALDRGIPPPAIEVVHNGIDVRRFAPDLEAQPALCAELGLPLSALLIGLVARWDSLKGHHTFIRAAAILAHARPDAHFVLVGRGVDRGNEALVTLISEHGIAERVHLLGERSDISRLTAGFDIATCSSVGEGFPNVVGEAMACGIPCVTTDVGDCALVIGDRGKLVAPGDPQALADGWAELAALTPDARRGLGQACRARIVDGFTLEAMTEGTASCLERLLARPETEPDRPALTP